MTKTFGDAMFYKLHTTIKCFKLCYIKEQMNCNVTLDFTFYPFAAGQHYDVALEGGIPFL